MNDAEFKEKVYGPYLDTWKIVKLMQHSYRHLEDAEADKANDEVWAMYMRECDRLKDKYPQNQFVDEILNFLIGSGDHKGAGEIIATMNQEALNE